MLPHLLIFQDKLKIHILVWVIQNSLRVVPLKGLLFKNGMTGLLKFHWNFYSVYIDIALSISYILNLSLYTRKLSDLLKIVN